MDVYNIYCDESRHLENDREPVMLLGAVWSPFSATRATATRLREIKVHHGLSKDFEVKWTKVSASKVAFYRDVVDYFFDSADLHFRAVIIRKDTLDHQPFDHSHDTFYYKMYFNMLKVLFEPRKCAPKVGQS